MTTRITMDDRWVGVEEAMVLFNTTKPGVYNLAKRNKWQRRKRLGRVQYRLSDLLDTPRNNPRTKPRDP